MGARGVVRDDGGVDTAAGSPRGPRPTAVTVAYRAWLVAAVGLVLVGVYLVTGAVSVDPAALSERGLSADQVGGVRLGLGVSGALATLVGLAVGLLAGRVRDGSPRHRRALVALSVVFTFVAVVQSLIGVVGLLVLPLALVMLGCVVLVTRPGVSEWFHPRPAP